MPDESEKQHRKTIRDQFRDTEKRKAEAELPASKEQLKHLFDWLDVRLENGCDHTFQYSVQYIRENDLDEERTLSWLRMFGGHCDCEVLANVEDACPAFR